MFVFVWLYLEHFFSVIPLHSSLKTLKREDVHAFVRHLLGINKTLVQDRKCGMTYVVCRRVKVCSPRRISHPLTVLGIESGSSFFWGGPASPAGAPGKAPGMPGCGPAICPPNWPVHLNRIYWLFNKIYQSVKYRFGGSRDLFCWLTVSCTRRFDLIAPTLAMKTYCFQMY